MTGFHSSAPIRRLFKTQIFLECLLISFRKIRKNLCKHKIYVLHGDLLHVANLRQGPTALLPLRRKACWGIFSPLKIRRLRLGLNSRLYYPSEGRRAEDFFSLKNPTTSAGFEPANLGTKASTPPLDIKKTCKPCRIPEWTPLPCKYMWFES
jgi:hypothetical protein